MPTDTAGKSKTLFLQSHLTPTTAPTINRNPIPTISPSILVSNPSHPHPLPTAMTLTLMTMITLKTLMTLIEQDFALAATVVSHSSNSCVESVIEGIPSFVTSKKSVAWDVTSHDLSEINNPKIFDREQWLNNLAYTQWNLKEIEKGLPFKHLGILI